MSRIWKITMKHIIVGTAGHIDHGKTALVKALTGMDADRLKKKNSAVLPLILGLLFSR
jgi:selenocysteine-specific elongation factor